MRPGGERSPMLLAQRERGKGDEAGRQLKVGSDAALEAVVSSLFYP